MRDHLIAEVLLGRLLGRIDETACLNFLAAMVRKRAAAKEL
jgi:hypothetical protein